MCNLTKQQLEYNTVAYLKMYGKDNNALACIEDVWNGIQYLCIYCEIGKDYEKSF